jgi:hypothetical protein
MYVVVLIRILIPDWDAVSVDAWMHPACMIRGGSVIIILYYIVILYESNTARLNRNKLNT